MPVDHDDWMRRDFEEHPFRQARRPGRWWIAAIAAVVAVVGVIAFLSASPSATQLQAARARGLEEARTEAGSRDARVAAALAQPAPVQRHAQTQARATEIAARAGAADANATAHDASAISLAPQP